MNVSKTCNSALSSPAEAYIYMTFYGLLFLSGLALNVLALWVFCCRMKKWTETRVYMVNLALADSGLILLFPVVIYFARAGCLEALSCQVPQGIYVVNAYMSISIPTVIGVDRYLAIRHPLKAKVLRTPGRAAIICVFLWVLVVSMLSFRVVWQLQDGAFCFWKMSEIHMSMVVFSLLGFFIPLGILVFCTFQIVGSLRRVQKREPSRVRQVRKSVYMVLASLLVFVVCFLPLHVTILLNFFLGSIDKFRKVFVIVTFLANTNCCLDAVCYYFVAEEFQEMTPFFCLWWKRPRAGAQQDRMTCTTLM